MLLSKGKTIAVAQDSFLYYLDKKEDYIYYDSSTEKMILAIFVDYYDDKYCKIIVNDKIKYVEYKDLREIRNEQINKTSFYQSADSF